MLVLYTFCRLIGSQHSARTTSAAMAPRGAATSAAAAAAAVFLLLACAAPGAAAPGGRALRQQLDDGNVPSRPSPNDDQPVKKVDWRISVEQVAPDW